MSERTKLPRTQKQSPHPATDSGLQDDLQPSTETRTSAAPLNTASADQILRLQRMIGNAAVQRMLATEGTTTVQRNPLTDVSQLVHETLYGDDQDRTRISQNTATFNNQNSATVTATNITIANGKHQLRGRHYVSAITNGPYAGKTVLFFSGSGGSAENQGKDVALFYAAKGADMVSVNYRGYGNSSKLESNGQQRTLEARELSEEGLYSDAHAIFDHMQSQMGLAPADIIVQGFSLGGAVASELVAHLAKRKIHVGGLILESPIDSNYQQAVNAVGGFKGFAGRVISGASFNTADHLKSLSKQKGGKDIPLHFIGGTGASGDQLGMDQTGLDDKAVNMGFKNVTSDSANTNHMDVGGHMAAADQSGNLVATFI